MPVFSDGSPARGGFAPATEQVRAATRAAKAAGFGDVFGGSRPVEPPAQVSKCGEVGAAGPAVKESPAPTVSTTSDGRSRDGGHEGASREASAPARAEGDDDEARAGGVPGVASLFGAGAREEQGEVVLAEAEEVGEGAPAGEPFAVAAERSEQETDVGVDGHGEVLAGLGEVVLDAGAAGLAYQCEGAGVQAGGALALGGGEFFGGPLPVGRAVGVEGVGGLAGLVEVGDGEGAGLGGGSRLPVRSTPEALEAGAEKACRRRHGRAARGSGWEYRAGQGRRRCWRGRHRAGRAGRVRSGPGTGRGR